MTLTDTFEKVFILTLPGAEERRAVLEGHLREVGIVDLSRVTWVRAVAGSVCPPPIWFRAGEGAWGCFCSHVRMAQDAAMDGVESYFVIEDDATFRADACERLGRVMAELPEDWGQPNARRQSGCCLVGGRCTCGVRCGCPDTSGHTGL